MNNLKHENEELTEKVCLEEKEARRIEDNLKAFELKYSEALRMFPKLSLTKLKSLNRESGGDIRRCRSLQDVSTKERQDKKLLQQMEEANELAITSHPGSQVFSGVSNAKNIRALRRSSTPTPKELLSVTPLLQSAKRTFSEQVGHSVVKEEE